MNSWCRSAYAAKLSRSLMRLCCWPIAVSSLLGLPELWRWRSIYNLIFGKILCI